MNLLRPLKAYLDAPDPEVNKLPGPFPADERPVGKYIGIKSPLVQRIEYGV